MDALRRLALRTWTGTDVALGAAMATAIALSALLTTRTDKGWPLAPGAGVRPADAPVKSATA